MTAGEPHAISVASGSQPVYNSCRSAPFGNLRKESHGQRRERLQIFFLVLFRIPLLF
ncbi:hypothetical protein LY76DRAFT_590562 [Colletotrichum caudatum]|nr:hypothetical protein LY76DRAFT_590562 [Colletotrichum caudatum]